VLLLDANETLNTDRLIDELRGAASTRHPRQDRAGLHLPPA
jgi:hypothetical protein